MQIIAKYRGTCKKCGATIHVGDKIEWERGQGATHVKCPERENERQKLERQLESIEKRTFVPPKIEENDDLIVNLRWYNGEYLSGYMASESKPLESLGFARYVSGWGTKVDEKIAESLGKEFTVGELKTFAIPKLEQSFKLNREREIQEINKKIEKFREAELSGKPVVLKRWSEPCNDYREECDIDNVTVYANPDGTTKKSRSHSW